MADNMALTTTVSSGRRDQMFYKGQPERRSASAHFTLDPQVSIDVDAILQATSPIEPRTTQDSNRVAKGTRQCAPVRWQSKDGQLNKAHC